MVQLIKDRTKPTTKSQGRLKWKDEYGKPTEALLDPTNVFKDTRAKEKVKKARWEDRNAIDLLEVRAKLKKIQKEN